MWRAESHRGKGRKQWQKNPCTCCSRLRCAYFESPLHLESPFHLESEDLLSRRGLLVACMLCVLAWCVEGRWNNLSSVTAWLEEHTWLRVSSWHDVLTNMQTEGGGPIKAVLNTSAWGLLTVKMLPVMLHLKISSNWSLKRKRKAFQTAGIPSFHRVLEETAGLAFEFETISPSESIKL